ncbi:MAG: bifunctional diaminohydroxyphosphoribosylaminopyrimidine deaminase/5-amino-6-(5-phosphoribosylamino)uracil reductase RibD [Rhodoluna sp.]|jgi:diaminohydroxyphosphoribosylaminopyrimidine deaminase/5-amino-6-(5-phosphoribosylamino)uracil reductase
MLDKKAYEPAMRRAMELSLLGPKYGANPQVGAVILDENLKIIAEGFHNGAGSAHAEVNALQQLEVVPAGATAVVTLEPCNHQGRTGPCAKALIDAGISRVIFGASDPGDASANGAKTLQQAGVAVLGGLLADEITTQQKTWFTATNLKRPFITLKWAQTLDGRSAASDKTSKWISGTESRNHVHKMRSEIDAIIVGTSTAILDDPELTARKEDGSLYEHQPMRVIIGERTLPNNLRVFNDLAETEVFATRDIKAVIDKLYEKQFKHVLVEGGARLISAFLEAGLFDEILIYQAPLLVGGANVAVEEIGVSTMQEATQLSFSEVSRLGQDVFIRAIKRGEN